MDVNSQPPDRAALRSGKQPSVLMVWEAGWTLWASKQFVAPRTRVKLRFLRYPALGLLAVGLPTELFWLYDKR